jgi:hypothetical protein
MQASFGILRAQIRRSEDSDLGSNQLTTLTVKTLSQCSYRVYNIIAFGNV